MEPAGLPLDLVQILFSRIAERAPVTHSPPQDADLRLELTMDPTLDSESFRIEDAGHRGLRITGDSLPGLLAGMGHFLRLSSFSETGLIPASWRGISRARKPVRGVYFATHFFNYYHAAPEPEIQFYLEDLALWGFNTLMVWFDRHHFKGLSDPAAQAMLSRLHGLLGAARRLGMQVGLCVLGNEAYADSPTELRAEQGELWSFGVEMCPAKPGALDRMIREYDETFLAFSDLQPDFLAIGPYDQGGCTCPQCRPWGGRGFLRMVRHIAPVFKRYSSKGHIILSTWLFDHEHHRFKGDWPGLAQALDEKALDADMILAGTHGRQVPDYLRTHPVPGALPLLGFPEISMRGMCPWGGFGANPMPEFLAGYWAEWGHRVTGGLAYSEGIYEDLNKAIMARLFWDDASPEETIRQYIAYEFGPAVIDPVQNAIRILEANQERPWEHGDFTFPHVRLILPPDRGSQQALAALQAAERHMNPNAREGWRWRLLILRARIDAELFASQGVVSPACETCFEELTRLYHAEQADFPVHPPTRSVR
jgi:hypothetical protein